jgi:hypothetical protein
MAKGKPSISAEDVVQKWELVKRAHEEDHEQQAEKELLEWARKWRHTDIADTIIDHMGGYGRRSRGRAFDAPAIVVTVVLLEKIGMTKAAAKKQAAERFHTTLRNVQSYIARDGAEARQLADLMLAGARKTSGEWLDLSPARLTPKEKQKLDEITCEK